MKQTSEYIDLIKTHADELRSQFGVRTLRLFGSVSRGEQHEGSDVDVCVEMEPRIYLIDTNLTWWDWNADVLDKNGDGILDSSQGF